MQIYETIMVDYQDEVTTGLLSGVRFAKDNHILPRGFDKATADEDIAVRGAAAGDDNFDESGDVVLYDVDVAGGAGPFQVQASLWYQPIGYRWAINLKSYDTEETNRFTSYYDGMAQSSGIKIAGAELQF